MEKIILLFQVLISALLIALILLQSRGRGLGSSGWNKEFFSSKTGPEKAIFMLTIILAILFLLGAIFNVLVSLK